MCPSIPQQHQKGVESHGRRHLGKKGPTCGVEHGGADQKRAESVDLELDVADGTKGMSAATAVVTLRCVGNGVFGSYIASSIAPRINGVNVLSPAFTRRSGLTWELDVLGDGIGAVYIATPDAMHADHAVSCLEAGKHVLVEKPVYDFSRVQRAAENAGGHVVLMVGFHRRHDSEYQRAKAFVQSQSQQGAPPTTVLIESYDPVPADSDMQNVVRNSVVHDLDLLFWMFPEVDEVTLVAAHATNPGKSALVLDFRMKCAAKGYEFKATIKYHKLHNTYTQHVVIDGNHTFGHDFEPNPKTEAPFPNDWAVVGPVMAKAYEGAYINQFEVFAGLAMHDCNNAGSNDDQSGGEEACARGYGLNKCCSFRAETLKGLLRGYTKTFQMMEEVAKHF